jgi:hypothetical protein
MVSRALKEFAARLANSPMERRLPRWKTDEELAKRVAATEDEANRVLCQARERAADVLRTARKRADERMLGGNSSDVERAPRDLIDIQGFIWVTCSEECGTWPSE